MGALAACIPNFTVVDLVPPLLDTKGAKATLQELICKHIPRLARAGVHLLSIV
jgi:hypothetical protein